MGNTKDKKNRRKKEQQRAKLKKSILTCLGCMLLLAAIGTVIWLVIYQITFSVKSHADYSVGLNPDGTIIGFEASDVTLPDLGKISVKKEDLTPAEEDIDNYINLIMGQFGGNSEDFDDEFVQTYYPEMGSSVEEFRNKYREETYNANLENYLLTYLDDHTEVKHYPDGYVTSLMGLLKGLDEANYESAKKSGSEEYRSFRDYVGFSKKEYYASLRAKAQKNADHTMGIQAVLEKENLTVDESHKNRVLESYGVSKEYYKTLEDTYGEGFLNQAAIRFAVLDYLKKNVTLEENKE